MEVGFLQNIPKESPYRILQKNNPLLFQVSSVWSYSCLPHAILNLLRSQPVQIQLENKWEALHLVTNKAKNIIVPPFLIFPALLPFPYPET